MAGQSPGARLLRQKSLPADTIFTEEELSHLPSNVLNIPRTCGKLSSFELDITENHDATSLLELLNTRAVTAKAVLGAFMRRAAIAQQLVLLPSSLVSLLRLTERLRQIVLPSSSQRQRRLQMLAMHTSSYTANPWAHYTVYPFL